MSEEKQNAIVEQVLSPPKSRTYHLMIFGGALTVLVFGGVWRGGANQATHKDSEVKAIEALKKEVLGVQSVLRRNELEAIRDTMAEIPRGVAPSVVAIRPSDEARQPFRDVRVYGMPLATPTESAITAEPGSVSGLVIDRDGYILTTASVLQFRFPIQVVSGSDVRAADLTASDSTSHLALLKLQDVPAGLVPADMVKIAALEAGEWLVREGRTPAAQEARSLHLLESFDTTISGERVGLLNNEGTPYMDGAVLVNVSGRIAGIYVHPPGWNGFVVPMHRAIEIATRLKRNPRNGILGWTGMELQALTDDLKDYFSVTSGILVSSVQAESPAAKAGVRPMDLIERINDAEVNAPLAVLSQIEQSPPGTQLSIAIRRNSRAHKLELTVAPPPGAEPTSSSNATIFLELAGRRDGGSGAEVLSIRPQSSANRLGVKSGDVIMMVDARNVQNVQQFWLFQRAIPDGKSQLWKIQRGDKEFFIAIKQAVSRP